MTEGKPEIFFPGGLRKRLIIIFFFNCSKLFQLLVSFPMRLIATVVSSTFMHITILIYRFLLVWEEGKPGWD